MNCIMMKMGKTMKAIGEVRTMSNEDETGLKEMGRENNGSDDLRKGAGGGSGLGPKGECYCPNCRFRRPHLINVPCYTMKCPQCGALMTRI